MLRLKGVIQHYAWGDRFALPELLDVTADGRPWAELWFGTHPRGAAQIDDELHRPAPSYLADEVGELPFIVKLLAAARPLSLQTHPSAAQAQAGFAREEAARIPLDAPHRVFADTQAKPEMVIALDEFAALCGFVTDDVAIQRCTEAGASDLAAHVQQHGVGAAARAVLSGAKFASPANPSPAMQQITEHYDDPRALVALLMHHVKLTPGESLYLDAGTVHAYLYGTALEVQGSSDNVLRAAFTEKHVDLEQFLAVASLEPTAEQRVATEQLNAITTAYRCAAPFRVMRHEINGTFSLAANTQHTLLVCTSGSAGSLTRGAAAYLAAGESIELTGAAAVYTVSA
jgi:mannose-6-phosphate isomerase